MAARSGAFAHLVVAPVYPWVWRPEVLPPVGPEVLARVVRGLDRLGERARRGVVGAASSAGCVSS
jgi:hypothetical protein